MTHLHPNESTRLKSLHSQFNPLFCSFSFSLSFPLSLFLSDSLPRLLNRSSTPSFFPKERHSSYLENCENFSWETYYFLSFPFLSLSLSLCQMRGSSFTLDWNCNWNNFCVTQLFSFFHPLTSSFSSWWIEWLHEENLVIEREREWESV